MRTIKFRAWDKEEEKWIYAEPVYGFFPSFPSDFMNGPKNPDRYGDVQEFTNLLDKNGKPIYEGDIVSYETPHYDPSNGDNPRSFAPITWEKSHWELIPYELGDYDTSELEIIGDIYTTPELLK